MPNESQQLTTLSYVDWTGGMNSAVPPTSLQDNEYQLIRNFEFNFNKLVTRGGLSAPLVSFPANIKAVHYIESSGECLVVLANKDVYYVSADYQTTKAGSLNGNSKPTFCNFDSNVFIASGNKLQYYDSNTKTVKTISTSKNCDNVFERFGRLVITVAGDDNLYYSAVGSPYVAGTEGDSNYFDGWADDTNDDSTSKWTEVGYKDDGDIIKVLPIASDIAVFKNNGRVYTISSEYPNWTVQQIAEHTDAQYQNAIVNVGSDIAFMTNSGLKTLTTTAVYGNFTTDELARKINRSVATSIINPMMFNLVRKRQLIIVPDTSNDTNRKSCYCYQYDIGAGVKLDFAYPIYDMQDTPNGTIIASGKSLYRWSFDYATDNGTAIEQEIVSKKYATSNRLYTRMVDIGVEGETGKTVTMKWANKTINYKIPEKRRMINVFSVCRDSVFGLYTTAKISLEYIKLYIFEQ